MRNIKSISLLLVTLALSILSCRDEDNPNLPKMERVPIPLLTVADDSDVLIQDPSQFKGKFTLDMFFKNDVGPKQVDVVIKRTVGENVTIKTLQEAVTSFPTTIDLDVAKLAAVFGIDVKDIKPGDSFEVGANVVTQSGLTVPAFSDLANQFSADIASFPGASLSLTYPVVCPMDLSQFVGKATVTDGFWDVPTYDVTISREGENTLVITGLAQNPKAVMKVVVDPKTVKTTASNTALADKYGPYTNLTAEGNGVLDQCNKKVTLNLDYNVDQGNFGIFAVTIEKK